MCPENQGNPKVCGKRRPSSVWRMCPAPPALRRGEGPLLPGKDRLLPVEKGRHRPVAEPLPGRDKHRAPLFRAADRRRGTGRRAQFPAGKIPAEKYPGQGRNDVRPEARRMEEISVRVQTDRNKSADR